MKVKIYDLPMRAENFSLKSVRAIRSKDMMAEAFDNQLYILNLKASWTDSRRYDKGECIHYVHSLVKKWTNDKKKVSWPNLANHH